MVHSGDKTSHGIIATKLTNKQQDRQCHLSRRRKETYAIERLTWGKANLVEDHADHMLVQTPYSSDTYAYG